MYRLTFIYIYKICLKDYTRNGESGSLGKAHRFLENRSDKSLFMFLYSFQKEKKIKAIEP